MLYLRKVASLAHITEAAEEPRAARSLTRSKGRSALGTNDSTIDTSLNTSKR